jgi:hypothetical protein
MTAFSFFLLPLFLGGVLLYILKYASDDVSTSQRIGAVNTVCSFNV